MACCDGKGPGYATPMDAMRSGSREKLLYVTCARTKQEGRDAACTDTLATVDVDPESKTYCQIISTLQLQPGDQVHHSGWNACSSCFGDACARRSHMILPCLDSSRVYVVDTSTDPRRPTVHKVLEPSELFSLDASFPHTTHCLADGNVMISVLGDAHGNNKGGFVLLDSKTFALKGRWETTNPPNYNYDYWYQPYHNVMVSTEWGAPNVIKQGFKLEDVNAGKYGHTLNVWKWDTHQLVQQIELDPVKGCMPLEVRFKHEPTSKDGFCGSALGSCVYHIFQETPPSGRDSIGKWNAKPIIELDPIEVKNWPVARHLPALITDIILSLDDRFLYVSLWLHGELHQYDVTNPDRPVLVDTVKIGGMCVHGALEPTKQPQRRPTIINGTRVEGGPQMLQLSLDGKRLYVTTSLYTVWDLQFFPKMKSAGSCLLRIHIPNPRTGGMRLDPNFLVDFGAGMPDGGGPSMAHEMRYPGGDCSSDIWLVETGGGGDKRVGGARM